MFGGEDARLEDFCRVIHEMLPATTSAVLRGSAVTGVMFLRGLLGQPYLTLIGKAEV